MSLNIRKKTVALIVAALLSTALLPAAARGLYGYKLAKDPLLLGAKRIFKALKKKDIKSVRGEVGRLEWQYKELRSPRDLNIDTTGSMSKALKSGSLKPILKETLDLVYLAMAQKFHWNIKEKLKKHAPARSRLNAAEGYYKEIFAGNVKRYDALQSKKGGKKKPSKVHGEILGEFKTARQALGSLGVLGVGSRPPDLKTFKQSATRIVAKLRVVFPQLTKVKL